MAGHELKRVLGRGFSIAASLGLIIGLGILRTPGEIATTVQEPAIYMALWVGGGALVLLSLLVTAEVIAITPRSGGMYALIRHAYGPYPGFLIGWTDWISNAASSALKAVVVVEYISLLIPSLASHITGGALLVITVFAVLQLGGVRLGGSVYQAGAALVGLVMLILAGALIYGGTFSAPPRDVIGQAASPAGIASFGLVVAAIVYTYDGWMSVSYFCGEIRGGGRIAALGSIRALLIVIFLYLLLNFALVYSVPLALLQGHDLALSGALDILFGQGAGLSIIWLAIFILLAHQNIQYMVGTRILYALSVDGLGSSRATKVSGLGTPTGALVFNWLLMCALVLAGGFQFLLSMAALLWILMYVAVILGVFRLRGIEPDTERPYRAWGFPLSGFVAAAFWIAVAIFVAVTDHRSSLYTAGLVAVSLPAYRWLKTRRHL